MIFQKKEKKLLAVADGNAISLTKVPDEAFASGLLGVGFAVDPSSDIVCSPVNGTLQSISKTRHAYTIQSEEGLDILVHVGIDTVELNGEGFVCHVHEGDSLKAGDRLATVDFALLKSKGYDTLIPVLISNPEKLIGIDFTYGRVLGGKSETARYRLS